MGRLTDTEQIRIYCNNNPGGVLDLSYVSKRIFKNIPIDNLGKYLSRLCDYACLRLYSILKKPDDSCLN